MYLSRVQLDDRKRETIKALACPQIIHGAVEWSFTDERTRNLWRIDYLHGKCYLLIQSQNKPDFDRVVDQFGFPNTGAEIKEYGSFLNNIDNNEKWRFRLRANPVLSKSRPGERGRVYANVTLSQHKEWLLKRAERLGFYLETDWFDVVESGWSIFPKKFGDRNKVSILTSTFEGFLLVKNGDIFRESLKSGIGRAKAYGCGLLTIARI